MIDGARWGRTKACPVDKPVSWLSSYAGSRVVIGSVLGTTLEFVVLPAKLFSIVSCPKQKSVHCRAEVSVCLSAYLSVRPLMSVARSR